MEKIGLFRRNMIDLDLISHVQTRLKLSYKKSCHVVEALQKSYFRRIITIVAVDVYKLLLRYNYDLYITAKVNIYYVPVVYSSISGTSLRYRRNLRTSRCTLRNVFKEGKKE